MLVRLDPDANATTVLSIPRDLKVDFTYRARAARRREDQRDLHRRRRGADREGDQSACCGSRSTTSSTSTSGASARPSTRSAASTSTSTALLPLEPRPAGLEQYAEIDVSRRLPETVRHRRRSTTCASATPTPTSCAPRASRTSCARRSRSTASTEFIDDPHRLTQQVGRYMRTDAALQSKEELLQLVKLAAFSAEQPDPRGALPGRPTTTRRGASYVVASAGAARAGAPRVPLAAAGEPKARPAGGGRRGGKGKRARARGPSLDGLVNCADEARTTRSSSAR